MPPGDAFTHARRSSCVPRQRLLPAGPGGPGKRIATKGGLIDVKILSVAPVPSPLLTQFHRFPLFSTRNTSRLSHLSAQRHYSQSERNCKHFLPIQQNFSVSLDGQMLPNALLCSQLRHLREEFFPVHPNNGQVN